MAYTPQKKMAAGAPEWAIPAGVLIMITALILPAVWGLYRYHHLSMAREDINALRAAMEDFHSEYGIWPSLYSGEYGDYRYGRSLSNALVINVLRGVAGPGNPQHAVNPRQIGFIEVAPAERGLSGLDSGGNFIDPWGVQYQIVLDTDLDESCDIEYSIYGYRQGQGAAIWSCGYDGISDTADDILSWEL